MGHIWCVLFEGLVGDSIMAICEFNELDFVYGEVVVVFGFGLGLLLCIGRHVLVLLGIGVGWGRRCI